MRRHLLVMRKLHSEVGSPLRKGSQLCSISKHFRKRYKGLNNTYYPSRLHTFDLTPPRGNVPQDISQIFLGSHHLQTHDGFKEYRIGLFGCFLKTQRTRNGKSHIRGVHLVITSIHQSHLNVNYRIARKHSLLHSLAHTFFYRRNEFLGNSSSHDFGHKLKTFTLIGLHYELYMSILSTTTSLLDVFPFGFCHRSDGLFISHLRTPNIDSNLKFPHQTIYDDLKMQLSHTPDEGLSGLLIGLNPERRILERDLLKSIGQLFLIGLGFGLHSYRDHRIGNLKLFKLNGLGFITEGVSGGSYSKTKGRYDISGLGRSNLLPMFGVHPHQTPNPLPLPFGGVINRNSGLKLPGIDPKKSKRSNVRIGHDLEGQSGQRPIRIGNPFLFLPGIGIYALYRRNVQRRRQIIHNSIQERLHPFILESRPTEDRYHLEGQGSFSNGLFQLLLGNLVAFKVFFHNLIIYICQRLNKVGSILLGLILEISRNLLIMIFGPESLFLPNNSLHIKEIHYSHKTIFRPDRNLQRERRSPEPLLDFIHHPLEIGPQPVHLVHKTDPRHPILIGLTPDSFRLGLYSTHSTEDHHRPIKDTKTTLDLNSKIHVPRSIDDVDTMILPETSGSCRSNGNTAFLLLNHEVHGGGAFMHLTNLVSTTSVIKNTLGGSSLPRVDMSHKTNVTRIF
ncbi:Hemagglutinin 2 [Thermosulfurimonas dismutans]|uniref:Hemagglutinin 2 n=1 Tax=Thermosulfurimonas dismutans TaxID=999894 RepID=A0A179D287_9BACT|nr:Hemagglutinin 2 [Thermosulfurimonas dismutans]